MSIRGKILVVDDEPGVLSFISRFLQDMQIEVTTAADGLAGLEKIHNEFFDLVISDIRMPGLNGFELYEQAKHLKPQYTDAFIFVSGDTIEPTAITEMDRAGCPFLVKPFTGSALRSAVLKILQKKSSGPG